MAKKRSTMSGLGLSRILWPLLTTASLVLGSSSAGARCGPWEMLSPHPHGRNLADVVWGGDRFVAVGYSVTQWSPDGVTWEMATHEGTHLNAVAWTGTEFVAVGDCGVILRSPDGASWSPVQGPTSADLTGIAWGGGDLVAVSENRQAFRSADGLAWDPLPIPAPQGALRGVVHADGGYCIFGDAGTVIVGSGTSWAPLGGANHPGLDIVSMAVLGGRYYVQADGQLMVFDGAQWTDLPGLPYGSLLGREGGRLYIVVDRWAYSSPDGTTWTSEPGLARGLPLRALALAPTHGVAVGDLGVSLLQAGGTTWELTSGPADQFNDIASNGQVLVLASTDRVSGTYSLLSSTDGSEWTRRASGSGFATRVVWAGDRFVAFKWPSSVTWSLDGATWTSPLELGVDRPTDMVSFRGRHLALIGFGGYACPVTCATGYAEVLASTDLESWRSVWHDETKAGLMSVASNGNRLVATRCCQEHDTAKLDGFVVSDDGETWTPVNVSEELPVATQIVWTGSRFVAAGGRVVMESADGLSWSVISRPTFSIHDLGWAGNVLLAAGMWESYPLVASSRDGRIWDRTYPLVQPGTPLTMPLSVEPWGKPSSIQSTAGNPRLQMAVGAGGTLLRRECEPEPTVPRRRLGRRSGASQP